MQATVLVHDRLGGKRALILFEGTNRQAKFLEVVGAGTASDAARACGIASRIESVR